MNKDRHSPESASTHHRSILEQPTFPSQIEESHKLFVQSMEKNLDEITRLATSDCTDTQLAYSPEWAENSFESPIEPETKSYFQRTRARLAKWWESLLERECPLMDDFFDFHGN